MALPQPRRWKGPDAIKSRAEAGGWRRGEHLESDKETGIWRYDPKVEYQQDAVLRVYATWRWDQSDQEESYEECVKRFLCPGAPLPQMHELKCFWRFYQKQSKGLLCKHPTVDTLKNRMKQLNGGLHRYTKQRLEGTTVSEINHFLKRLMPYEDGSETRDVHRPKYNFKPPDLKRLLNSLWNKPDLHYIHERDRIQFHLKLIWFASTGGRIGGLLKKGIPYKDIHLVLRRTDAGEPYFIYQLDQRYYKNNPDPKNKTQGNAETDYPVLLLDSVSLILTLAIADDALNLKDLTAMLRGKGEGPVDWNEHALDVPICRHIHRNGNVDPNESMHEDRLRQILSQLLEKEAYVGVAPRIHSIRREVGRQLDKLYTPVERSQHVGQADLNVWGRSYVAAVSSCDGLRAFLREKTNHEAVEYFQGIERFRQPGLPTTLPAARRDQLRQQAKQEPHTPFRKLEQMALKAYQQDCLRQLRQDSLFGRGRQQACGADPDLLNSIMPEKGQVAKMMARTTPLSVEERLLAICCMVSLATSYQGVFYRPGEEPCDGRCPYCQTALNSIKMKRSRSNHIHRCRRKAVAKNLGVLQSKLKFCYFCMDFRKDNEWEDDCQCHLLASWKRYGAITYRSTQIRPAFCLLCKQSEHLPAGTRMQYWDTDAQAIRHMEEEHDWPWSCRECNFAADNADACYHHLHDSHGYLLGEKRRFGSANSGDLLSCKDATSNDSDGSPGVESDDWMSEYIEYPHSPSESPVTDVSASGTASCISPSLLCSPETFGRNEQGSVDGSTSDEEVKCLDNKTPRKVQVGWKPEIDLVQVKVFQAGSSPEIQDCGLPDASSLDPLLGRPAMAPAEVLDLAFTARSSLSLLNTRPSDVLLSDAFAGSPLTMETSSDEDLGEGMLGGSLHTSSTGETVFMPPPPDSSVPTVTVTDISSTSSESSPRSPSLRPAAPPAPRTTAPRATGITGSTVPGPVSPGGKKRRIRFTTASCNRNEDGVDAEAVQAPPRKKCRIILKTKPRIPSGDEHAGDAKAVQAPPRGKRRNKQTKVAKPTNKRIILNKQAKGTEPMHAILDKQTQVAEPTKTRIILKTDSRRLHKRSWIDGDS